MTIPDICSDLLLNWKSVQTYLSRIAPSQENQEVRNMEAVQEEFVVEAKNYLVFLLEKFLSDFSFNADLVRGLSSFNPMVLLTIPTEQASLCFSALYHFFNLRCWVSNSPKAETRDEYLEFVDHFRKAFEDL